MFVDYKNLLIFCEWNPYFQVFYISLGLIEIKLVC